MDPNSIAALAVGTFTALQPYLPVLAAKAAEKIAEKIPSGIVKLWSLLRERFARNPNAEEALKDLLRTPEDPDAHAAFRIQLRKLLEQDSGFAAEVKCIVDQAGQQSDYAAVLQGSGAIAQGPNATAIGAGGVLINQPVDDDRSEQD